MLPVFLTASYFVVCLAFVCLSEDIPHVTHENNFIVQHISKLLWNRKHEQRAIIMFCVHCGYIDSKKKKCGSAMLDDVKERDSKSCKCEQLPPPTSVKFWRFNSLKCFRSILIVGMVLHWLASVQQSCPNFMKKLFY